MAPPIGQLHTPGQGAGPAHWRRTLFSFFQCLGISTFILGFSLKSFLDPFFKISFKMLKLALTWCLGIILFSDILEVC